jgi:hypothetical protein
MSEAQARELEAKGSMEKLRSVFGIVGSALDLGRSVADFYGARSQALVDAGMGLGEYMYLYVLSYGVWLGHPLEETPVPVPVQAEAERPESRERHETWNKDTLDTLREDLRTMLKNQLAARSTGSAEAGAEDRALAAEIGRMEHDPARWPWQDGLPQPIAAAFEPYRARLEASYDAQTNMFELMRSEKKGQFQYEVK